jgi:hypothetical protein
MPFGTLQEGSASVKLRPYHYFENRQQRVLGLIHVIVGSNLNAQDVLPLGQERLCRE